MEHVDNLAEEYALGMLDAEERAHVEQHSVECPPCRKHVQSTEDAAHLLALAVPPVVPPSRCKLRLMEKVAREQFLATPTRRGRLLERAALWAAPTFALLVVAISAWSMSLQRELSRSRSEVATTQTQMALVTHENGEMRTQVAQLAAFEQEVANAGEVRKLSGSGATAQASALTYMTPGKHEALLLLRDLPPLPSGKAYQVWVAHGVEREPLEVFDISTYTPYVKMKIAPSKPIDHYDSIMVTIEDAGGSSAPSSDVVLAGDL